MPDAEAGSPVDGPAGYPRWLESDARTTTGTRVHLRPIRPDDSARLGAFHQQLSWRSVYFRYLGEHTTLSDAEVERLTHVDYADRLALVALVGGDLVGVGRYERTPGAAEAEVAFVVADGLQHQGIGSMLLAHLADAARANGIREFVALTSAENRAMIDVFLGSGFPVTSTSRGGSVNVRFPIDGTTPAHPVGDAGPGSTPESVDRPESSPAGDRCGQTRGRR